MTEEETSNQLFPGVFAYNSAITSVSDVLSKFTSHSFFIWSLSTSALITFPLCPTANLPLAPFTIIG